MRVLLCNTALTGRTGTELWIRDVARAARRRGLEVAVHAPTLGPAAAALRREGLEVVADPAALAAPPDVIHGNHRVELVAALARFPAAAGVFMCHDARAWHSAPPPPHPRVRRHLAVCTPTRERLAACGVDPARTATVPNAVDLERFRPRGPLPARPARALLLSSYAREDTHLPAVREACRRLGLPLAVVGEGVGAPTDQPERVLPGHDLVFAKARSALEALAVGCAVVVCDRDGVGPMVTAAALDGLRARNFGFSLMTRALDPVALMAEVARYDARDAAAVSARIRAEAGLEVALEALVATWTAARDEAAAAPRDADAELRATGALLGELERHTTGEIDRHRAQLAHLGHLAHLGPAAAERDAAREELRRLYASPTLRALGLVERLRRYMR